MHRTKFLFIQRKTASLSLVNPSIVCASFTDRTEKRKDNCPSSKHNYHKTMTNLVSVL